MTEEQAKEQERIAVLAVMKKIDNMSVLPDGFTMADTLKMIQIINMYYGSLAAPVEGSDNVQG